MPFIPTLPADAAGAPGIGELRRQLGISQVEIAGQLGVTQPCVAKIERQEDMRLSTLRRYVAGLGGELRLIAEIDGVAHELDIGTWPVTPEEKTSTQNNRGLQCNSPDMLSSHA